MFYSRERQKLIKDEDNQRAPKEPAKTKGDAEGVTLGFNTGADTIIKNEILLRKF